MAKRLHPLAGSFGGETGDDSLKDHVDGMLREAGFTIAGPGGRHSGIDFFAEREELGRLKRYAIGLRKTTRAWTPDARQRALSL